MLYQKTILSKLFKYIFYLYYTYNALIKFYNLY